jgi:hypothetical protein
MGGSNEEFIDLFQEDINGVHIIYDHQYLLLDDSTSIYKCAKGWIILSPESIKDRSGDRKDCLLKSYIYDADDTEYKMISKQILKANNFILPEIAKAFGIEAATYGRFKIDKENDSELRREENIAYYDNRQPVYRIKPDTEYILTPSFLNNDEEFKAFGDIIPNDKDHNVGNVWRQLERFLLERSITKENIKQIRKQYALKSIFGAYVELNDNHNYNDGLIFTNDRSNRSVRLAPAYDLDYAMRVYNVGPMGRPITFIKLASDGGMEVTNMLKEFKDDLTEKDFDNMLKGLHPDNIMKIILDTDKKHHLELTPDVEQKYMSFFTDKYRELGAFYKARYGKDIDD